MYTKQSSGVILLLDIHTYAPKISYFRDSTWDLPPFAVTVAVFSNAVISSV